MDLELKGMVGIVTGASGGIGRSIVATLLGEGMSVVANDLSGEGLDGLRSHFDDRTDARLDCVAGDIGVAETGDRLVARAIDRFGRLDVLVHNAGITTRQSIVETPYQDWERVMRTNLYGAYFTAAAAAREMIAAKRGGALIAISSLHGRVAKADMGAYCTTKAGINMMFQQLAVELAPHGIRSNVVAPGTIDTGMNPVYHSSEPELLAQRARLMDRIPMARLGEARDIARLVAFLASPVSAYTTGAVVFADGGYTADGTPR